MKKIRFVFLIAMFLGIVSIGNVYADSTVLYYDGTLIINEKSEDRDNNIEAHGSIIKTYHELSKTYKYEFTDKKLPPWYFEREKVKTVKIGQKITPTSTAYWFENFSNMEIGDFENLDTSKVTDMSHMFDGASSNVTTFELNGLSSWDTSQVTNMSHMFSYVGQDVTTFELNGLSSWDTSQVTNMRRMFSYVGQNVTIFELKGLSNWDVSQVTDMSSMFAMAGNDSYKFDLDLSNLNMGKVTNMYGMFAGAGENAEIFILDLSKWDTSSVTNMSYMFGQAGRYATTLELKGLSNWDVSQVTDMRDMFNWFGRKAKTFSIDLSKWDTSSVTNMSHMFYLIGENSKTWSIGDLSNWDVSQVTDMSYMFYYAGFNATTWSIGDLSNWNVSQVTDMSHMFYDAGYYNAIYNSATWSIGDLSNWNTSQVTDMRYMFYNVSYNGFLKASLECNVSNLTVNEESSKKIIKVVDLFKINDISHNSILKVTEKSYANEIVKINILPSTKFVLKKIVFYNESNEDITLNMNYNEETQTFIMPEYDVTIKAVVEKKSYSITKQEDIKDGTIEVPTSSLVDDNVKVNTTPDKNYRLSKVTILKTSDMSDVTSEVLYNKETQTFIMPEYDVTIKVEFEEDSYFITKQEDIKNGVIEVQNSAIANNEVKINISPDKYYRLSKVTILKTSDMSDVTSEVLYNEETQTFIMPNYDVTIKAIFEKKSFSLSKSVNINNGIVDIPISNFVMDEVKINISPDKYYRLSKVTILKTSDMSDVTSEVLYNEETQTFIMPEYDVTIKVEFEEDSYFITKQEDIKNGYMEVPTSAVVEDEVKINIVPDKYYKLSKVTILKTSDMSDVTNKVSYDRKNHVFTMPNYDVTIKVEFLPIEYKISTSMNSDYGVMGGNININNKSAYNSKVDFSISLDTRYLLKSIKILDSLTEKDISALVKLDTKNYSFIMPDYDVKIELSFIRKPSVPETVITKLYGHDDVKISWSCVYNADGYLVYYKKSTSKNYTLLSATTATSIKKANLTDGAKYYFKIVPYAKDLNGIKRYNTYKVSSIYTLKRLNTPIISKYSKNYVKIKWNNISGESGYQIARKKYGTSAYYIVKNVSYKYSSTIIKTTRNTTYYYKVRAYKVVDGIKIYGPWSYVKSYKLK